MNYYELLEISENASKEMIYIAYRTLAKKYHPDLQLPGTDLNYYKEKMILLNKAYSILFDEDKRAYYDSTLKNKKEYKTSEKENPENDESITWSELSKKWMDQIIEDNKSNIAFDVKFKAINYTVTNLCTCCLDKPQTNYKTILNYTESEENGKDTITKKFSLEFPICKECYDHQNDYRKKRKYHILLSLTLPIIFTIIILNNFNSIKWLELIIYGIGPIIVSVLLLNKILKLPPMGEHHVHRFKSVEVVGHYYWNVRLRFYNRVYADLFAKQNNASVEIITGENRSSGSSILEGKTTFQIFSWVISLMIIINTILFVGYFEVQSNESADVQYQNKTLIPSTDIPRNGSKKTYYSSNAIAPLRIVTKTDNIYYFIKVVKWNTNKTILTAFIHGGKSVNFKLPLGEYEIRYATGKVWYGEEFLFGDSTVYSKANKKFEFKLNGDYVDGYTIELFEQINGNLHTTKINKNNF